MNNKVLSNIIRKAELISKAAEEEAEEILEDAEMAVKALKTTDTIYVPIRNTYESNNVAKTEIVYRNTGFAKFCIGFFWSAIAAVVGYVVIRILRARL